MAEPVKPNLGLGLRSHSSCPSAVGRADAPPLCIRNARAVSLVVASLTVSSVALAEGITLPDPAPTPGSVFGDSLIMHRRWVIVGDRHRRTGPPDLLSSNGGLVMWERSAAGLPVGGAIEFQPSGLKRSDRFGESITLAGDILFIGAPGWDKAASQLNVGRVHVVDLSGATPVSLGFVNLSDFGIRQELGGALAALEEDGTVTVAAGAPGFVNIGPSQPIGPAKGRVQIYQQDGGAWTLLATYVATSTYNNCRFGSAVGLNGTHIAIGAPGGGAIGTPAWGRVFLYERNVGTPPPVVITAPTPTLDDHFGAAIAMSDDLLVVGASSDDCGAGVAHVYRLSRGSWVHEATLEPPSSQLDGWYGFGNSVGLDRERVIVGTGGIASDGQFGQRAAVFRRAGAAWQLEAIIDGASESDGPAAGLVAIDPAGALIVQPFGGRSENGALRYDVLPRSADLDFSGGVGAPDLAILLGAWGSVGVLPEDISGDGIVDAADLALLIGDWSVRP
jgi:FG-GAP repeat